MADDAKLYSLRGGRWGYDRLLLLSRERWPDTEALFRRAGLAPGMKCVDLGCGGGEVTQEMARLVSPGSVIGIDMDQIKLDLAKKTAQDRGLGNLVFRQMFVDDWNEPETYDACYSRFLLQHLKKPWDLLERAWASLLPNGLLMIEDVDWTGWSSDPLNPGLDFLRERYIKLLQRRGTDPIIGRKLYRKAVDLGIPNPQIAVTNPLHVSDDGKRLVPLTLEGTAEAMISEGVATREEVESAQKSLEELITDPHPLITGPKIFQLYARKPASNS